MKLEIIAQPFITASGKTLSGQELVVDCPLWLCKTNVRKVCGKCLSREKISYKEGFVLCKYQKKEV